MFEELQNVLETLGLDINNVRGQGYDNGSNMKGKHQGVQRKLLDVNPRALYTPCGCHSLNLTLCDIANSCTKAKDFFGVLQHIYTVFSHSTKHWKILRDNVKGLTIKPLSQTRWESHVNSVYAIKSQTSDVREALLQLAEQDNDPKIKSEAESLATHGIGNFEFLVAMIIWFELLTDVNEINKSLQQKKDMRIDVAIELVKGLIKYLKKYRESGFVNAKASAEKIGNEMEIECVFIQKRQIRRKQHYDENSSQLTQLNLESAEESFRNHYFLYIVDQTIGSVDRRFKQYSTYENIFGFLFSIERLRSLSDRDLKACCKHLETCLKHDDSLDLDGEILFEELKVIREVLTVESKSSYMILSSLKTFNCFPNACITYRIILTIPISVASAERSFSKLKLLKSYLRSTMSQDRLNSLALISIENNFLKNLDYERIINDFATKNAKRMIFK